MNLQPDEDHINNFLQTYSFKNLVNKPTCFKSEKGSCIDLILTNKKSRFKNVSICETGLSDYHRLISTTFKASSCKLPPIKKTFRNFKKFHSQEFLYDLDNHVINFSDFDKFHKSIISILDKHAPYKTITLRGNDKPYITKEIRKQIWKRSRLKNRAHKSKDSLDVINFKKQRNYVLNLIKNAKKTYFTNIEINQDKKKFWKSCNSFISNKASSYTDRIFLEIDDKLITNEKVISNKFNIHFNTIIESLNINFWKIDGSVNDIQIHYNNLEYFNTHPSIIKIKESYISEEFNFTNVTAKLVSETINNLKKGTLEMPFLFLN